MSGDASGWLEYANVTVAAAALLVASTQAVLVKQQARRGEVTLTRELVATWSDVQDSWRICMAVEDLGDGFYSPPLTAAERDKLARVGRSLYQGEGRPRVFDEEQIWLSAHARQLLSALGRVADLVLADRVSVPLAYTVFGHELTRRSRRLRSMLFKEHERWSHADTFGSQEGTKERILALVDLMWAEAVRRGDLSPRARREAADLKRRGSGHRSRVRVRSLSRAAGASHMAARRLERSLKISEEAPE